jgi:hypothetical protein
MRLALWRLPAVARWRLVREQLGERRFWTSGFFRQRVYSAGAGV